MNTITLNNGFEYSLNADGDWIWKAVKTTPLSSKNRMKEKPPFKVTSDIEKKYHQRFDRAIMDGVKDIVRYLN